MKYEDLTRMYWDLNNFLNKLSDNPNIIEFEDDYEDCCRRIEWMLGTINDELRELESNVPENL